MKVKIRKNPLIPYSNKSNSFLITLQLASQAEEYQNWTCNLHEDPLSTISAICPKVIHGHQNVMQPATSTQFQSLIINIILCWCHLINVSSLDNKRLKKKWKLTVARIGEAVTETSRPRTSSLRQDLKRYSWRSRTSVTGVSAVFAAARVDRNSRGNRLALMWCWGRYSWWWGAWVLLILTSMCRVHL